jgi:hypothetical protein
MKDKTKHGTEGLNTADQVIEQSHKADQRVESGGAATARIEPPEDKSGGFGNADYDFDLNLIPQALREKYFTPKIASGQKTEADTEASVEKDVNTFNELHDIEVGQAQLVLGMWVLVNVLHNDLQLATSKNPHKDTYYKSFTRHGRLSVTPGTVTRWVRAAAAIQEWGKAGLDTSTITYSLAYEISKLESKAARLRVAKKVVEKGLTVQDTSKLVKAQLSVGKASDSVDDKSIREKAKKVLSGLDDIATLIQDEELNSFLLDQARVRLEFNMDELTAVMNKAKQERLHMATEKAAVEERNETIQKSINFLEKLIKAIRGDGVTASPSQG